ncbi:hypothetical protein AVEN_78830-1, partial [Araneus ventricosus]
MKWNTHLLKMFTEHKRRQRSCPPPNLPVILHTWGFRTVIDIASV